MEAPYLLAAADVAATLTVDPESGLTAAEAAARRVRYGANELTAEPPEPAWRKLLAQFTDVLVLMLIAAALLSAGLWALERDTPWPYEASAILAIVILNALMGYLQQARAEQAVAALRQMSAAHASAPCRTLRGGKFQRPRSTYLETIILVEEGDTIPADGRLMRSASLHTAEAALTGESLPVSKDVATLTPREAVLGRSPQLIFGGTATAYGRARAWSTATGMQTEMGRIVGSPEGHAGRDDAAAGGTQSHRSQARPRRRGHSRGDDRRDPDLPGRPGPGGDLRCAHPGRGAGGRGGAGGAAGRGDRGAVARRPAHGEARRHRPPPGGGGNPWIGQRHRLGQDRHAYPQRDDGPPHRHSHRQRGPGGRRLFAGGGGHPARRRGDRRASAAGAGSHSGRRRPRQQCGPAGARGALVGAGRSDRGRPDRGGPQGGAGGGGARGAVRPGRGIALLFRPEVDEHGPR